MVNLLPLTVGRNLLEVTLIGQREIFSFAIFDVKYFLPVYVSDLFLLLIYQNYFSKKLFEAKNSREKPSSLNQQQKVAYLTLLGFFLLVLMRSIGHEFSTLLLAGSLIILKYILIFGLPLVVGLNQAKNLRELVAAISAMAAFHSLAVIYEQIKGGNLGRFIENRLPGLELGTMSSEAKDVLRADGIFNEPNITATFLLMSMMLLLGSGIRDLAGKKNSAYFYLGLSSLSALAIIFTGSRSLYFLTGLGLLYHLLIHRQVVLPWLKNFFRKKLALLAATAIAAIFAPYLWSRLQSISNVWSHDGSLSYRSELNSHVLSMSFTNYLGIGLDLTPYYLAKNFKTVDSPLVIFDQAPAHNIVVQLLAETGVIATMVFLLFIYTTIKYGYQGKQRLFAVAAVAYLLSAQFHPVFTNHYQLAGFFFLYLGIANHET